MSEDASLNTIYRYAVAAHRAGDLKKAAENYRAVLEKNYTHLPSLNNLAAVLTALGRNDEAIAWYEKGLVHHPESPELRANLASLLRKLGDLNGAAEHYLNCLFQDPSLAEIRYALGIVLRRTGRLNEAEQHLRQAAESLVDDPRPWTALSALALDANQLSEAEKAVRRALIISPSDADASNIEGLIAKAKGEFMQSREALERALAVRPEHAEARFNRGTIRLLTGEMPEGWSDFEWRWHDQLRPPGAPTQLPKWEGSNINGKTILLLSEQGFGDTIQFIRYAPHLQRLGAQVIVQCRKPLHRLITSAPGVDEVRSLGQKVLADVWIPLMSLPFIFRTSEATIPAADGYLGRIKQKKINQKIKKIGLVWAGSASHENDLNRSIALDDLSPLLKLKDYTFFSLQMGARRDDLIQSKIYPPISDLMENVNDFHDSIDRLSQIDLLITVDTAMAHLAGATGCKTFLLLPKVPDWRWMLDRQDTPWYRSVTLFRQLKVKNWSDPINSILHALEDQ